MIKGVLKMEEYRNKLKIQNVFFSVCSAVLIVVQILAYSGVIDPGRISGTDLLPELLWESQLS